VLKKPRGLLAQFGVLGNQAGAARQFVQIVRGEW